MFIHLAACVWLFVNKMEPVSSNPYFYRKNRENSTYAFKYVVSLEWTNDVFTGNSFGDATPLGITESITALFGMVVGASVFAIIFADFEDLMKLTRS